MRMLAESSRGASHNSTVGATHPNTVGATHPPTSATHISTPQSAQHMPGTYPNLSVLQYVSKPGQLSPVSEPEWMEIELTADSGACDTVIPENCCPSIRMVPSAASIIGIEYEVANSATIPTVGERHCLMWTESSEEVMGIVMQVADVHKPLLSLSRCADLGFHCILGKKAGCLECQTTGHIIPLR